MTFYWSLQSVPELADLPRSERGRLWRANVFRAFRHWQGWLAYLVMATCMGSGIYIGITVFDSVVVSAAIGGLFGGIGGAVSSQLLINVVRPYLRDARSRR